MTVSPKWAVTANIEPPKPKKFKRLKRVLLVSRILFWCVFPVALADGLLGYFSYRTATTAEIVPVAARSGVPDRALVVFPGHGMPGRWLSEAFAPSLPDDTMMLTVHYAPRGVDVEAIYSGIMTALDAQRPRELIVYGASVGGMVAREFLRRYARDGTRFGPVTLVLDAAPSSKESMRAPAFVFWLASWYRGGPLSTWIVSALRSDFGAVAEPDADPLTIEGGRHAGDWVGVAALTSQADFIADFRPLEDGELAGVVARAVYLTGHGPAEDPVVDTVAAVAQWRRALPTLEVVELSGRDAAWHVPLLERPRETVEAIVAAAG